MTVRFSDSTGIPKIPDTDPNANPQGFAVRFHLGNDANGRRVHTDVVGHSTPFFPARTGEEFHGLFQAISQSGPEAEHPTPVEQFLGAHPKALAFIQAPKPTPASFATQEFFGVNAIKLIAADGKETFVRYRILPALGHQTLEDTEGKNPDFLFDDIKKRIEEGPVVFKLVAQIAEEGDITDDATEHWPDSREIAELGEIKLDKVPSEEENSGEQKKIIFDPVPRVDGLAPSDDPILQVRAGVYLLSGRERRAA